MSRRSSSSTAMVAFACLMGGLPAPRSTAPKPELTPEELERKNRIELERIEAAAAKRRRKLARYFDTPEAKARRLEDERRLAEGEPWAPPAEPFPFPERDS
jgi:hypothetical protein